MSGQETFLKECGCGSIRWADKPCHVQDLSLGVSPLISLSKSVLGMSKGGPIWPVMLAQCDEHRRVLGEVPYLGLSCSLVKSLAVTGTICFPLPPCLG